MKHMNRILTILACAFFAHVSLAQSPIKLGVIAPMTGPASAWGLAASEGAKILADGYNKDGGLAIGDTKHPIEVFSYDDKYQAAEAVAAYNRLVKQDGVKYIVVLSSAGTVALRDMAKRDHVVILSGAYADEPMDKANPYLWRIYSPPNTYIGSMVEWLRDNLPQNVRKVAIVNPNDETGWGVTKVDEEQFTKYGFNIVSKTLFERATNDFQPIITKILSTKPDIIELGVTPPSSAAMFIRQAREMGYKGVFFMSGGSGPDQVVASAGNEATEGLITMMFGDPNNPAYMKLEEAYEARNKHKPNMIIIPYYDGPGVLLKAIAAAGGADDVSKVLAALPTVFPVKSLQGDEIELGGESNIGVKQQFDTVNRIAVVKNGVPEIVAKTANE